MSEKKCTECGKLLVASPDFFRRNKYADDGLVDVCKICAKNRSKKYSKLRYQIVKKCNAKFDKKNEKNKQFTDTFKSSGPRHKGLREDVDCSPPVHINVQQYLYEKSLKEKK